MSFPSNTARNEPASADCYSGGERAWMLRTQALRGLWFAPILRTLNRAGVTPDHLTLLSLAVGLAFFPLWFVSPLAAMLALALHVALDGIDGPLARATGVASRRGSFTDTLADQAVVTTSTIALMVAGQVGAAAGGFYIYAYAVVVALAMVRNALEVPYSWLFRPRLVVYVGIPIDLYLLPGTLAWLHGLGAALLVAKMISGFVRLRRRL